MSTRPTKSRSKKKNSPSVNSNDSKKSRSGKNVPQSSPIPENLTVEISERRVSMASAQNEAKESQQYKHILKNMCRNRPATSRDRALPKAEYLGARHYVPHRLPSARPDQLVSLKIEALTEENLEFLMSIGPTLKRLDLSSAGILLLPQELLESVTNLERINLDYNSLRSDSFTPEFSQLMCLKEISVRKNVLAEIPTVWFDMKFTRLIIDANKLSNLKGIEKLIRLKVLVADRNSIINVPKSLYMSLKRLEYLSFSKNKINVLLPQIKYLTHLKFLDLSNNSLTTLPTELFLLRSLEHVNLSHNNLIRIPTINIKVRAKNKLNTVDLSQNSLTRFPEQIMRITEHLDLSNNRIKAVPPTTLKRFQWNTNSTLDMSNNLLISPTQEIANEGLRAMILHYHETKLEAKTYQGFKMLLLGSLKSGKTSLVQTLLDQQTRLTDYDEEMTNGIDAFDIIFETIDEIEKVPKTINISCFDFSGSQFYEFLESNFVQLPALSIIAVDLSKYSKANFRQDIGMWIDLLIMQNNGMAILLVGTFADLLNENKAKQQMIQIRKDTEAYLANYIDEVDKEIINIENMSIISSAQSELYKQYQELKSVKLFLCSESVIVSCAKMIGLDALEKVIVDFALRNETFPHLMREVPSIWADVENYFDDKSGDETLMTFDEFAASLGSKFGLKQSALKIGRYLQESGKAYWLEDDVYLKEDIVLSPLILFDCLRMVLRSDLQAFLNNPNDPEEILRRYAKISSAARYPKVVGEFIEEGILDPELIQAMWSRVLHPSMIMPMLRYICLKLQFAYPIGKRIKDGGSYNLSPLAQYSTLEKIKRVTELGGDSNSESLPETQDSSMFINKDNLPRILFPCYRREENPSESLNLEWRDGTRRCHPIIAAYRFPRIHPVGLFEKATVIYHDFEKFKMRYVAQWKNGVHMRSLITPCLIRFTRTMENENDQVIQFEVLFEQEIARLMKLEFEDSDSYKTEMIWSTLLPLLTEFDKEIKTYPGLWYRRMIRCPKCGELAFMGEWRTPKETQAFSHKTCPLCDEEIETIFLIQPKEKRRVTTDDEILKMKQQAKQKRSELFAEKKKSIQKSISEQKTLSQPVK